MKKLGVPIKPSNNSGWNNYNSRKSNKSQNTGYHNRHNNAQKFNPNQSFVICIITPKGREVYFGGFKREIVRTGFLKLKKESYEYEDNVRNIYDAKRYSTKDAADFMADKLRKDHPKCHISVLKIWLNR